MAVPKLTNNLREVMRITGLTSSGAYERWLCFVHGDIDVNALLRPRETKAHLWDIARSTNRVVLVQGLVLADKNYSKVGG